MAITDMNESKERSNNFYGQQAKKLADSVSKCFNEVIGNPPNQAHSFHSTKDIIFIMNSLNAMVSNYLELRSEKGRSEGMIIRAECLPPIEFSKSEAEAFEKILSDPFQHPAMNRRKRNRRRN
jgi:hypothetical protein